MKRFALMVLVVLALAAPAFAGIGTLAMYADDQGSSCNVTDAPGLVHTYILHVLGPADGSTGTRFSVTGPVGWTFVTLVTTFVPVGNAATDISLGYGGCQPGPLGLLVGDCLWSSTGSAVAPCSYVTITPSQVTLFVDATDCNFAELHMPKPGQAIVNPDQSCQCNIAVKPSTWGQVKALYR
jgi:hypothetical protein